jgi:Fe-S cluster assembly protein SufD
MTDFFSRTHDFLAHASDAERRRHDLSRAKVLGPPSTSDEVWRYAPLHEFDLDAFHGSTRAVDTPLVAALSSVASTVVSLTNGQLDHPLVAPGLEVSSSGEGVHAEDFFGLLGAALTPSTVTIDIAASIEAPIVIVHHVDAPIVASNVVVSLAERTRAVILEVFVGGDGSLVVPHATYHVKPSAHLTMVTMQRLDDSAWSLARTSAQIHANATVRQSVLGLGARYNRSRNDAEFLGAGAHNELLTTYLGRGMQVHDFRTHQHHVAGRTTSTLLSKGAVADTSRSIYTGLIDIERGAKRVDARQTNHNLLLSPHAHADTVPNLDIKENDVACAHASSVGPLNELQRWYLESRGVARPDAERLMVQGFFNETLAALPVALATILEDDVASLLGQVVGRS